MPYTIINFIKQHSFLLLTGSMMILYVATFSGVSSVDAYYYYTNIDKGPFAYLCHPHHLAYLLVGKGWVLFWQALGYNGPSLLPMKVMSLLGALGILIVFKKLICLVLPRGLAAHFTFLALGCSYLPWHYSTEGEPVIFFQFFSIWILYFFVRWYCDPQPTTKLALKMGIVVSLGTLFHQALFFIVPLYALAMIHRGDQSNRLSFLVRLLVPVFLLVAVPYLTLGYAVTHSYDPRELVAWATGYLDEFTGIYGSTNLNPSLILRGMSSAFLGGTALKPYFYGGQAHDLQFYLAVAIQILAMGLVGSGVLLFALQWRAYDFLQKKKMMVVGIFTLIFIGAAIYWEPVSRKFWAPIPPGLLLLAGCGWVGLGRIKGRISLPSRFAESILGCLFLVLLVGNLQGGILHKHKARDLEQGLALNLLEVFQTGDLLVMQADRLWQSVDYNFPEIRNARVEEYVNQDWAAADTTLNFAAKSMWETLQSGDIGYVSSKVDQRLTSQMAKLSEPAAGRLEKSFLFRFADQEQANKESELWSWRWIAEEIQ